MELISSLPAALPRAEELFWPNPQTLPTEQALSSFEFSAADVADASARLERFAPLVETLFPETAPTHGIIESPLTEIPSMRAALNASGAAIRGRLFLKRDGDLPVAGSVKARGGIYEVLKHSEDLALREGLLRDTQQDYRLLASDRARAFFSRYKMQVGSTGNLGMSIGIMSAALGYEAIVHMSSDAKQWKKDLLRSRGVTVMEYAGDYGEAVANGRRRSEADPTSYFVDDENSRDLFFGYAVAAERLQTQLDALDIHVDAAHPLFVYIPCGVGGAPGGVCYGLKLLFGDAVRVFFVEPTQAPCMLLGLASGRHERICVQDIGLTGKTEADGLAVGRPSALISRVAQSLLSGAFTVEDSRLTPWLRTLYTTERLFIEPSACAAFMGPFALTKTPEGEAWLSQNALAALEPQATHIVWSTGGRLVPESIRRELLKSEI